MVGFEVYPCLSLKYSWLIIVFDFLLRQALVELLCWTDWLSSDGLRGLDTGEPLMLARFLSLVKLSMTDLEGLCGYFDSLFLFCILFINSYWFWAQLADDKEPILIDLLAFYNANLGAYFGELACWFYLVHFYFFWEPDRVWRVSCVLQFYVLTFCQLSTN